MEKGAYDMKLDREELFPATLSSVLRSLKLLGIFKPGVVMKITEEAVKDLLALTDAGGAGC